MGPVAGCGVHPRRWRDAPGRLLPGAVRPGCSARRRGQPARRRCSAVDARVPARLVAARTIRVIPQARAGVVERLGRYSRTLQPGLTIITPFIDRVRPLVDLREQVVNFSPQSVITEDNVVVGIETVLYFTITDPRSATYEIANPLQAIEQLTVTTLRDVIGGLTLEATLTSRE